MKKWICQLALLTLLLPVALVKAQEEVEPEVENEVVAEEENPIQNDDIIKTEVRIGNQTLFGHDSQHIAINAKGESNVFYNDYGHFQVLPFKVFIFTHYQKLDSIQIKNLKVSTVNFIMDKYHLGIGAPSYTQQKLGFGYHMVNVKTVSPLTVSAFHKVSFDEGKTVLEISGYVSLPGKAYGFGENARYEWEVDGNHVNGTYVPAGVNVGMDFNKKVQVNAWADYQHFSAKDGANRLNYDGVHYGLKANVNLGEALTHKLRGVNLFAAVSNENLKYSQFDKGGAKTTLNKQSWLDVQTGVSINLNARPKKKVPVGFN